LMGSAGSKGSTITESMTAPTSNGSATGVSALA